MGYEGGRLMDFYPPRVRRLPPVIARQMADHGGTVMTDKVQEKTPVITGEARKSNKKKRTRRVQRYGVPAYESGTYSNLDTMLFLEYGTQPHLIVAQSGYLAFEIGGRRIYRRQVNHPGTKGLHMYAITAAEMDAGFVVLMNPFARRWAKLTENMIRYRMGSRF